MQWSIGVYILLLVLANTSGLPAEKNPAEYGEDVVAEENTSVAPNDESANENREDAPATATTATTVDAADNSNLVKSHMKGGGIEGMGGTGKPSIQVIVSQTTRRPTRYPHYPPYNPHEPYEHHPHSPYPPSSYPQQPQSYPPQGSPYGSPYGYYPQPSYGYYPSYYNVYPYNRPPYWWLRSRRDGLVDPVQNAAPPVKQNNVSPSIEDKPSSQETSALKSVPFWSFLNFGFNKK